MESGDSGHKRGNGIRKFLFILSIISFGLLSSIAFAADTVAPSTPANLDGTADPSSTRIDLSWSASTDNVAVTAYLLERCKGASCTNFAQIASVASPALTYSNTGLTPATSYSYRVRARDAANNKSGYSPVATILTPPDTQAPSIPSGIAISVVSDTQLSLTWAASTDNVKATGYLIERCAGIGCNTFTQVATPTATTYNNTALTPSTSYSYRIRAKDAAGNLSDYSNIVTASTPADTQAPTAPTGLTATVASNTKITLAWVKSTDDVKVTSYLIERCGGSNCSNFTQVATTTSLTYGNTGLTAGSSYSYRVRAADAAGNLSDYSSVVSATTTGVDAIAPTVPTGVTATAITSTQINLTWTASSDNVAVANYIVERCDGAGCSTFSQISTPTTPSYNDANLLASTNYSYRIRATDAVNNNSAYSFVVSATTPSPSDTQPPTSPSGLSTFASSPTQINLLWTASSDDVSVTNYLIERCQGSGCSTFTQIATSTTTAYSDSGLIAASNYSYRIRATDAANNLSSYSNIATGATQYAGPVTFSYSYDNLGRVIHANGSDGSVITYTYDANGNITSIIRQ